MQANHNGGEKELKKQRENRLRRKGN